MKTALIIGSGFAGLSAACTLAQAGVRTTVLERHTSVGGRARSFSAEGFTWDMGPSWYWMPDVFERFFARFGKRPSDYYDLVRLDPSYDVVWSDETISIPAKMEALKALFEKYERGSGARLESFLDDAGKKYGAAMGKLVYQPSLSASEFMRGDILRALLSMNLLQSVQAHARHYFQHPKLLQLVEFPILFLGALPQNTPALYTLMNYADMVLGTWYPIGGMAQIATGMERLAESLGVAFRFGESATKITADGNRVTGVKTDASSYEADVIIAACDYHHAETLLQHKLRNYSESYWASRDMAPSSLLYYIGINKKLPGLQHHNLFFDAPFEAHAAALYKNPKWPEDPLMYVCAPSRTDAAVAPEGCENLFVLIPVAPGLSEDEGIRQKYFDIVIKRLEARLRAPLRENIVFLRSYAGSDFTRDYSAYKGNAYGLANTLRQTAILKPSIRNKKLRNLFYAGQLTVPGPGVPPAIISGQIVAEQALRLIKTQKPVAT